MMAAGKIKIVFKNRGRNDRNDWNDRSRNDRSRNDCNRYDRNRYHR
jgi:hypothetical protein